MSRLWQNLYLRAGSLLILQLLLLIGAESEDGLMSLIGVGIIMLPTTALLLATSYAAIVRGRWLLALFTALGAFPGFIAVLLWLMLAFSMLNTNR